MQQQLKTINDIDCRITLDDDYKIIDIEFNLTPSNRESALRLLYDKHINKKNSAYTYIFQGFLAKYHGKTTHEINELREQLAQAEKDRETQDIQTRLNRIETMRSWMSDIHELSTWFIDFEYFINKPGPDYIKSLYDLKQKLCDYAEGMEKKISFIEKDVDNRSYRNKPQIRARLRQLQNTLKTGMESFSEQMENLLIKGVTREQVQCLMCIQTRDLSIKSLGTFMAEQMIAVLDCGINVAYDIRDARLNDLFDIPLSIAVMSDAKKLIHLKAFSLDGAEYNDTYSAIRPEMLHDLTGKATSQESEWMSIKPYLADWSVSDVDEVICLITGVPLHDKITAPFYVSLCRFAASALELAIFVPIRLAATLLGACIDLMGTLTHTMLNLVSVEQHIRDYFTKNSDDKITNKVDRYLSKLHYDLSPVMACRNRWGDRFYTRYDETSEHQMILNMLRGKTNFFHDVFDSFTSQGLADYIKSGLGNLVFSPIELMDDLLYSFSSIDPKNVYQKVKSRHHLSNITLQHRASEHVANRYCPENEISSPLEVFREIVLGSNDGMIDPMFRKYPGFSTLYFMLATATFGTYLSPAAVLTRLEPVPAWLQRPTDLLSHHFFGKTTESITDQLMACFLEWELTFFATRFVSDVQKGNFDFFKELIKEPEQVTMGLGALISTGVLIRYLPFFNTTISLTSRPGMPVIHNYYAELINLFISESREGREGTLGLTGMKYSVLGLKFFMLIHSMLSGAHKIQTILPQQFTQHPVKAVAVKKNDLSLLEKAREELLEAIQLFSHENNPLMFECNPSHLFSRVKEPMLLYDYMDKLFNIYNCQLRLAGKADMCLDKRDFLDVYYNKYCDQGSSNLLRSLFFVPVFLPFLPFYVPGFYLAAIAIREIKRLLAWVFNKPSLLHQVQKSYHKDAVMLFQIAAMVARTAQTFSRTFSYLARMVFISMASVLYSVYAFPYMLYTGDYASGYKAIDQWACEHLAFHRTPPLSFARTLYAHSARTAGSNQLIHEASDKIVKQARIAVSKQSIFAMKVMKPTAESLDTTGLKPGTSDRAQIY